MLIPRPQPSGASDALSRRSAITVGAAAIGLTALAAADIARTLQPSKDDAVHLPKPSQHDRPVTPTQSARTTLCTILRQNQMSYEVSAEHMVTIPVSQSEAFTVSLVEGGPSSEMIITITAPPSIQGIIGGAQRTCTSAEEAAHALLELRERLNNQHSAPSVQGDDASFHLGKVYDA